MNSRTLKLVVDLGAPTAHPVLARAADVLAEDPTFMEAISDLRDQIASALVDHAHTGFETWSNIIHFIWEAALRAIKGDAHVGEIHHSEAKAGILSTVHPDLDHSQIELTLGHMASAISRIASQLGNVGKPDLATTLNSLLEQVFATVKAELNRAMQS